MLSPNLFLPYVVFAVIVTAVAAWRAHTPRRRWWTTAGLLVFFFAFAHSDDILGAVEHKWLCHEEAGFWVYKPARLPKELYDAAGKPKFMTDRGPDKKLLAPYLIFDRQISRNYKRTFLKIDKRIYRVRNRQTGEIVGESITFFAWPSEFIPTISHISASGCFDDAEKLIKWNKWERELFRLQ